MERELVLRLSLCTYLLKFFVKMIELSENCFPVYKRGERGTLSLDGYSEACDPLTVIESFRKDRKYVQLQLPSRFRRQCCYIFSEGHEDESKENKISDG